MAASKFDGNATLSLWVHRYFTKDCFIDAVTSSCSDLFGFIASPLNWHFGGSTMVHPIFRHRYIYIYGLWFGTFFFHILGISSSQLTFTPSFFRGVGLNHHAASSTGWTTERRQPRRGWSVGDDRSICRGSHGVSMDFRHHMVFFSPLFGQSQEPRSAISIYWKKNIDQHTVLGNSWKEATNHPSYGVMSIGKHSLDIGYFMLIFRRSSHRRKCIVFVARTSWINSDIYYHH